MTYADVCALAKHLPDVVAATSYGKPALKAGGKLLVRLKEDGETLVLPGIALEERAMLMEAEPGVFFITDHYRDWPSVLVRLPFATSEHLMAFLLRRWRAIAPKKIIKAWDCASGDTASPFARLRL